MKIVALHGSPKGDVSITLQSLEYLRLQMPGHELEIFPVGTQLRRYLKRGRAFDEVVGALREADLILWSFPVYYLMVPAQLKVFIELLFELEPGLLQGKLSTSLSTSAHYFDHTAHAYVGAVSEDLGMYYVPGFSAHMEDLLSPEGQADLAGFARSLARYGSDGWVTPRVSLPVRSQPRVYQPELPEPVEPTRSLRVLLLEDAGPGPEDANLRAMIEVFCRSLPAPVERISLRDMKMKGGCLGCMHCADGGDCVYKDDYGQEVRRRVLTNRPLDGLLRGRAAGGRGSGGCVDPGAGVGPLWAVVTKGDRQGFVELIYSLHGNHRHARGRSRQRRIRGAGDRTGGVAA